MGCCRVVVVCFLEGEGLGFAEDYEDFKGHFDYLFYCGVGLFELLCMYFADIGLGYISASMVTSP